MKATFITLRSTPHREQLFREHANCPVPAEPFYGFDGNVEVLPPGFTVLQHKKPSAIGCFMSHYLVWKHQAENGPDWQLIMEDDCRWRDNVPFWEAHQEAMELDADLWYPGGHCVHGIWRDGIKINNNYQMPRRASKHLAWVPGLDRLHGYVLSRRCAQKMMDSRHIKTVELPDWWLRHYLLGEVKCAMSIPWMCGQDQDVQSTITGRSKKGFRFWDLPDTFLVPTIVPNRWEDWMSAQPHFKGKPKMRSQIVATQRAALRQNTFCVMWNVPEPEQYFVDVFREDDHLEPSENPDQNRAAWAIITGREPVAW